MSVLSGQTVRVQIERKTKSTSGVNNINAGGIRSLIVPSCGAAEQHELMTRLAGVLPSIEAIETEIDNPLVRSESRRQSILKKAFSGQLVPQDPNDEPASVLLERIRAEKAAQVEPRRKRRETTSKSSNGAQPSDV
ncbi:MAG: hypothetical protein L0H73_06345 [Nitrococcus sp.]|nr:hypothetical protein [Nitrococcus sp.]